MSVMISNIHAATSEQFGVYSALKDDKYMKGILDRVVNSTGTSTIRLKLLAKKIMADDDYEKVMEKTRKQILFLNFKFDHHHLIHHRRLNFLTKLITVN